MFFRPILPGRETFSPLAFSFFIENHAKDKRIVFDLGIRKDPENGTPAFRERVKTFKMDVLKDVATQLNDAGIELESVDAVIWSHGHFDHTGDITTFPSSTELVFGEGTKRKFFPPYPQDPKGFYHENDFKDRKVTEISFEHTDISIGGFRSYDYFSDGSFYLLDVPGHVSGHIAALARVTPTTFVLMGGDTCHHPGMLRPNPGIHDHFPCPGSLFSSGVSQEYFLQQDESVTDLKSRPLLQLGALGYEDHETANKSIATLGGVFDSHPDVFVLLAHDQSLGDIIELFPASLNGWRERGWKERAMWAFLDEKNPAFVFKPVNYRLQN